MDPGLSLDSTRKLWARESGVGLTYTEVREVRFMSHGQRQSWERPRLPGSALLLGGQEGKDGQGACEGVATGHSV